MTSMAQRKKAGPARPTKTARYTGKERSAAVDAFMRNVAEWTFNVILLVFFTGAIAQPFVIPTSSMEDNLMTGDHLIVDKISYAPAGSLTRRLLPYQSVRRGDIIVFRYPLDISQDYVKRVIGLPGDRIRLLNKQVYLNGKPLNEPYKIHKTSYIDSYRDNFPSVPNIPLPEPAREMLEKHVVNGEVIVPAGHYFAMGDNRDNSADSRYWGFVPAENIVGKPVLVFWSYDAPTEQLADPYIMSWSHAKDLALHFFTKTRWKRTFLLGHGYPIP